MSSDLGNELVPRQLKDAMDSYQTLQYRGPGLRLMENHRGFRGWVVPVFGFSTAFAVALLIVVGLDQAKPAKPVVSHFAMTLQWPRTFKMDAVKRPADGIKRPDALKQAFVFTFRAPKRPRPEKTG